MQGVASARTRRSRSRAARTRRSNRPATRLIKTAWRQVEVFCSASAHRRLIARPDCLWHRQLPDCSTVCATAARSPDTGCACDTLDMSYLLGSQVESMAFTDPGAEYEPAGAAHAVDTESETDLRQGGRPLDLPVPRDRSARSGERRLGLAPPRRRGCAGAL